jgi:hypothetical protein
VLRRLEEQRDALAAFFEPDEDEDEPAIFMGPER